MEKLARIVPDQTRQEQVLRTVGAPSEIRFYRNVGLNGWNYPYKESNTWDSMMTIHVDDTGLVRRMENGPDPRRMPSDTGRHQAEFAGSTHGVSSLKQTTRISRLHRTTAPQPEPASHRPKTAAHHSAGPKTLPT